MFPYKSQMQQYHGEDNKDKNILIFGPFLQFLKVNPTVLQSIWITDKPFSPGWQCYQEHTQLWGTENPHEIMKHHCPPKNVWCGTVGQIFLKDNCEC
jgi:hypothetical protein